MQSKTNHQTQSIHIMKDQITNYIKAGYAGLFIVSHEEQRVEREMLAVASAAEYKLFVWSITQGMVEIADPPAAVSDSQQPLEMLEAFGKLPEKSIVLLRDFHMLLAEPFPPLFRAIKDALLLGKSSNRHLVITGCKLVLPPELEKEITVLDFALPDREQLRNVVDSITKANDIKLKKESIELALDAASGLTTMEAENAFALSIIETKTITPAVVQREKANTVRKNGLLEIIDSKVSLDDIGGLENLKLDLTEKRNLFTAGAREYGIPSPRGSLIVGQPGTGKSLTATATANIFGIPLLKLEAGKLFGSLVGQSESNWRSVHATAKAIAPCVLWIDEVDGLFCGSKSSGETDSGVTNRVIKSILQDMQMNSEGIFYMFTANDVDNLPDPLIDRLDVWSVDLPNQTEREAIWRIHIAKEHTKECNSRNPKDFTIPYLAKITEGFSGRQIEQVWLKALTIAFNARHAAPTEADCVVSAKRFTATSITMAGPIAKRRERLKDRCTPASAPESTKQVMRKLSRN